jgi:NADH-quinone oxidoreductase subunit D
LDFNVIVRENGDCYYRWICRIDEMRESVRIIEQCVEAMPAGRLMIDMPTVAFPVDKDVLRCSMETHIHHFELSAFGFKVPAGEAYVSIEAPKGELGFYIISDGSEKPSRMKVRAPSFVNLQALCGCATNMDYLADVIAMLGSLDPVIAEVDK